MKRKLKVMLMSMLLVSSLTACGGNASSKSVATIQPVTIDFNVASLDNGTISFEYPTDEWKRVESGFPAIPVMLIPSDASNNTNTNINVVVSEEVKMPLDKYLSAIPATYEQVSPNIKVDLSEIRTLDDKEVAYNENTVQFTDENIQKCIEKGILTEQMIEANGGKEALLNIPAQKQIQMTFYLDNKSTTVTGTYTEDNEKENVLKAMTTIVQTAKIK